MYSLGLKILDLLLVVKGWVLVWVVDGRVFMESGKVRTGWWDGSMFGEEDCGEIGEVGWRGDKLMACVWLFGFGELVLRELTRSELYKLSLVGKEVIGKIDKWYIC